MWMCLMPLCLVLPLYWVPISRVTLRSVHSLVQFSHSVVSDSLKPHGLQHTKLRYSSPTPGTCSNVCSLNQWCHPTISSSVVPFSFHFQSFPASGSFPKSQFFTSVGQSIGLSASASVLPMNIQGWLLLGLTSLISLQSKGHTKVFSSITVLKHNLRCSYFFVIQLLHPYLTTGKKIALTRWTFVSKVMSLIFNMLSKFVIHSLDVI